MRALLGVRSNVPHRRPVLRPVRRSGPSRPRPPPGLAGEDGGRADGSMSGFLPAATIMLATPPTARRVAVTFDDLPAAPVSVVGEGVPALEAMTRRLLAAVREARVPVIGFVNEGKLAPDGRREQARVALLSLWLEAGFEHGNHSYSHLDLNRTPLSDF